MKKIDKIFLKPLCVAIIFIFIMVWVQLHIATLPSVKEHVADKNLASVAKSLFNLDKGNLGK